MWLASRWRALDADGRPSASKMILRSGSSSSIVPRRVARREQALVGGEQRLDHRLEQRAGALVGLAVRGRLDLACR